MTEEACQSPGCRFLAFDQGWCYRHHPERLQWERERPGRDPFLVIRPLLTRTRKCIEWPYKRTPLGYGRISVNGKVTYVHRLVCERAHGPCPPGLECRHLCGNAPCFNPRHLKWDTHSENCLDRDHPERYLKGTR